jgi:hypothetical protein
MEHDDQSPAVRRLHELGTQPVDPDVAARHQAYLSAATPAPGRSRMRPLLAGTMLAGALLGGTGLAAALPGSLPEQAGSVAREVLAAAQLVDDEDGDKKAEQAAKKAARAAARAEGGPGTERFLEGCTVGDPPEPFKGNHGQYVKAHPDDPATPDVNERQVAAESDCGKPLSSLNGDDESEANEADEPKDETRATGADKAAEAKAAAEARKDAAEGGEAGRPESPGNSEGPKPPATADNEQGSENRATERGSSGDAGKAAENRPEGVGPPTSTSTSTP